MSLQVLYRIFGEPFGGASLGSDGVALPIITLMPASEAELTGEEYDDGYEWRGFAFGDDGFIYQIMWVYPAKAVWLGGSMELWGADASVVSVFKVLEDGCEITTDESDPEYWVVTNMDKGDMSAYWLKRSDIFSVAMGFAAQSGITLRENLGLWPHDELCTEEHLTECVKMFNGEGRIFKTFPMADYGSRKLFVELAGSLGIRDMARMSIIDRAFTT